MEALIDPLLSLPGYNRLLDCIKKNRTPVLTTGVIDIQQNHLMLSLIHIYKWVNIDNNGCVKGDLR